MSLINARARVKVPSTLAYAVVGIIGIYAIFPNMELLLFEKDGDSEIIEFDPLPEIRLPIKNTIPIGIGNLDASPYLTDKEGAMLFKVYKRISVDSETGFAMYKR